MKNFVTTHFNRVFSGLKNSNYSLVNNSNNVGYKDRTLIRIFNDYGVSNKNCLDVNNNKNNDRESICNIPK